MWGLLIPAVISKKYILQSVQLIRSIYDSQHLDYINKHLNFLSMLKYFDDKIYKYKTQESIDNFIKGISKILKSDTILIDSK